MKLNSSTQHGSKIDFSYRRNDRAGYNINNPAFNNPFTGLLSQNNSKSQLAQICSITFVCLCICAFVKVFKIKGWLVYMITELVGTDTPTFFYRPAYLRQMGTLIH